MSLLDLFKKKEIPPKTVIVVQNGSGDNIRVHSFTGQPVSKFDLMSVATKESGLPNATAKGDYTAKSGPITVEALPFDADTAPHILTIMGAKKSKQTPDPEWAVQMFPGL